ncbi:tlde1 domain-containing protein [Pantoea septica]|uniref:tlde1 domain-containing protein n=1 Tax=Pantoea septica TaxID=472695 RepID=UPI00289F4065|nr:tlde1 domain-containing protein [Pantoea septica]
MMDYSRLSSDGKRVKLNRYGVGSFDVLSGIDKYINNPNCSDIEKAAIPRGTYWIVDRPTGSIANQLRAEAIDLIHLYKNHHSQWAVRIV